jgi:CheY-like chemotaxis protein
VLIEEKEQLIDNLTNKYSLGASLIENTDMKKRRVLLVEDDSLSVKLYVKLLSKWGYDVSYANNGMLALEMLEEESYDLLLTDNQLPLMTGSELVEKVMKTRPTLKTLIVTGDSASLFASLTKTTVLRKPIIPDYLKFRINQILVSNT